MGGNLSERDKDEGALGKAWMRDFEAVLADVLAIEHKDVEVERARTIGDAGRAVAAELVLDGEQGLQQSVWGKVCFKRNDGVEEAGLGGKAYRLGGVKRGLGSDVADGCEARNGSGESCFRRPGAAGKVGAEADVCGWHESQIIATASTNPRAELA